MIDSGPPQLPSRHQLEQRCLQENRIVDDPVSLQPLSELIFGITPITTTIDTETSNDVRSQPVIPVIRTALTDIRTGQRGLSERPLEPSTVQAVESQPWAGGQDCGSVRV